jgi:hypothetical protein
MDVPTSIVCGPVTQPCAHGLRAAAIVALTRAGRNGFARCAVPKHRD